MGVKLEAWKAGYDAATDTVMVVQHWSGFVRARHGLVVTANGELVNQRVGNKAEIQKRYNFRELPGELVDEATAREHLQRLTGVHTEPCGCGAELPVAGRWCVECGCPKTANVAA